MVSQILIGSDFENEFIICKVCKCNFLICLFHVKKSMEKNIFYYALVARGATPLAEYSLVEGNHRNVALRMLEFLPSFSPMAIVEQNNCIFTTLTGPDGMTFLCLCDDIVIQRDRARLNFLKELREKWREKYGNDAASFAPDSKNNDFGEIDIQKLLDKYNKEKPIYGKIENYDDEIATHNLTMALSRGPQLSITEKKSVNAKTNKAKCILL